MLLTINRRRAALNALAMLLALLSVLPTFASPRDIEPGNIEFTNLTIFIPQRDVTILDVDGNPIGTGNLSTDVDIYPDGRVSGSAILDQVGNVARTYAFSFDRIEAFGYDTNGRLKRVTLSGEVTVNGQQFTANTSIETSGNAPDAIMSIAVIPSL